MACLSCYFHNDLAILSEVAEKIGVMYGGKMVEFGTSAENIS